MTRPRRELAKRSENVNRSETKIVIKNSGITAKVSGSTKYIKAPSKIQRRIVTRSVGRKFFLFRICSR